MISSPRYKSSVRADASTRGRASLGRREQRNWVGCDSRIDGGHGQPVLERLGDQQSIERVAVQRRQAGQRRHHPFVHRQAGNPVRIALSWPLEIAEDVIREGSVEVVRNDGRAGGQPERTGAWAGPAMGRTSATGRPSQTTTRRSPASTRASKSAVFRCSSVRVMVLMEVLYHPRIDAGGAKRSFADGVPKQSLGTRTQ